MFWELSEAVKRRWGNRCCSLWIIHVYVLLAYNDCWELVWYCLNMYALVLHRVRHTNKRSSVVTCNQIAYTNEVSSLQSAGVKSVHLVWRERLGCFAILWRTKHWGWCFPRGLELKRRRDFGPQSIWMTFEYSSRKGWWNLKGQKKAQMFVAPNWGWLCTDN
jgi:hypothetical protein